VGRKDHGVDGAAILAAPVQPRLVVHRHEQGLGAAHRFRAAQQQRAARSQAVVEQLHQSLLQGAAEVDHQVPARQDVESGERRIDDHVVLGEQHHVPDALVDLVAAGSFDEEARQSLRAHVGADRGRKAATARRRNRVGVEVGGKDLQGAACRWGQAVQRLDVGDRQRIGFFPSGTADNPGAQRAGVAGMAFPQHWQDLVLQLPPDLGVTKERGDANQHLLEQQVQLLRIGTQEVGVGLHRLQAMDGNAPGDAAHQRVRLVERQVVPRVFVQQHQYGVQRRREVFGRGPFGGRLNPGDAQDAMWHVGRQRDDVDTARGHGAEGHGVELRRSGLLSQRQPPLHPDRLQPQGAVGPHAGQHDADRPLAELSRQRAEQHVDRQALAAWLGRFHQMQGTAQDRQFGIGWNDVDRVGLDALRIDRRMHRHRGGALQQFRQQGLVGRVQVLHHQVRQAARRRNAGQELFERLKPAGGRTQPDDPDARGRHDRTGGCTRIIHARVCVRPRSGPRQGLPPGPAHTRRGAVGPSGSPSRAPSGG
jgi:hypothetical protein